MNDLLELKGEFEQRKNPSGGNSRSLPRYQSVNSKRIRELAGSLNRVIDYWNRQNKITEKVFISVYYTRIVAKSNRIQMILKSGSKSVCGAKFTGSDESPKHLITHYLPLSELTEGYEHLIKCADILDAKFHGTISENQINQINSKQIAFEQPDDKFTKRVFVNLIVDAFYIERFEPYSEVLPPEDNLLVSLYDTGIKTSEMLDRLGIKIHGFQYLNDSTVQLTKEDYQLLADRAPYLVAMAVQDINQLSIENGHVTETGTMRIPDPVDEPVIGVIDTMLYEDVYFSKWVDYHNMLDSSILTDDSSAIHGTEVSSIIVDGPALNPDLDDGCGRFRVRHFAVSDGYKFSIVSIMKCIRDIVSTNRDIKVWNLSLGSTREVNKNFISPEAAILDQIQYEYDVVFVVAATNRPLTKALNYRIGSPADSVNSIVVGSARRDGSQVSYARNGRVLSFFNRPDICAYGGDTDQEINVYAHYGVTTNMGTSFAAPWISRKMAYLIQILGMSRETAKALLIDSAVGWDPSHMPSCYMGWGVVPIRIDNIVKSNNDEIKFILSGSCEKYQLYNYGIPVPEVQGKFPYTAKATLAYYSDTSRNQGVDYTNQELDLCFGRVDGSSIRPINNDKQDCGYLLEKECRQYFRKWDNVKCIHETMKERSVGKKVLDDQNNWGISITAKERLSTYHAEPTRFGLVITLKEINGKNRIEDFIHQCLLKRWLVQRVNVENRIEVHEKAEEVIELK